LVHALLPLLYLASIHLFLLGLYLLLQTSLLALLPSPLPLSILLPAKQEVLPAKQEALLAWQGVLPVVDLLNYLFNPLSPVLHQHCEVLQMAAILQLEPTHLLESTLHIQQVKLVATEEQHLVEYHSG